MLTRLQEKIKAWENDIFIVLISILAILIIVGSGVLYEKSRGKKEIIYEQQAFSVNAAAGPIEDTHFIASRNGSKYYPAGCASINRIKTENKIYFNDEASAQKAGFEPSTQC
ncbi:MAG: hypothetical protein A3F26_02390 [Candidatus Ryanbacteria bacterium RIFCSPHIGHO2_12_FULL_47_12b]|uniref:Ada DNA repair metal-binding domain-containing protein n=2 Tax=Candidatus Ryaniibacteriota TaxID=1817914 RepID=A0A1G2H6H0_9BACT|nr:MAG: hypothetical protein UX74_C0003G0006 [Parcubacteria group bacterium GW2011_GWA2_47_10b]KKU85992.1 MAG: hypothetical protein UY14_C0009G0009 [Parcubacteria group bacterium GW2011_GWA1_47_9]OGZ45906.1 MAG: hypothetical protein A2844_00385 [Candidatus Ryanbacteria bacterium RIFCSPHIGHO2_01_FULL_48_80]OGZ47943.1 MAG: hypothetical protein A3C83_03025 [Candidatus Ryanbacteria bacterium RIFCSPHIGHO2_02_FULL_47_25]OGZ51597.1 MAG: hypothetical protein A3F26_02390 [Candidatus Ryanbacteria bacteri